jgi:hypothetical protein
MTFSCSIGPHTKDLTVYQEGMKGLEVLSVNGGLHGEQNGVAHARPIALVQLVDTRVTILSSSDHARKE